MARRASRRSRSDTVIAIDLGGTKVAVAAVDQRGRIRQRMSEPVDASSTSAPIEQMARLARQIPTASAVGIAVPGLVRADQSVWAPNLPGWDNVPLARLLRRRLTSTVRSAGKKRLPVFLDSDRNAAVLGESWRGAGRGTSDVIVLIIGTGIGAGILSGGRLIRGAHELSGCAGWMVVSEQVNAETRRCGSLEALAAGPALARLAGADTAQLADAARQGNQPAREVFARAGRFLGLAVANLISLFDPEVIVLTGGLTNAADLFLEDLKRTCAERAQPLSAPRVEIRVSTLGADANLLGAARLAFDGLHRSH